MEEKKRKYVIVDKQTTAVVMTHLQTRQEARLKKRELEYQHRAANGFRNIPSRYFVETDVDHSAGAGVYYH